MLLRTVPFAALSALLQQGEALVPAGLFFALISLVMGLAVLGIKRYFHRPHHGYDFAAIRELGTDASARITSIAPVRNVTINRQHPWLIGYVYAVGGRAQTDRFETLDAAGVAALYVGDSLRIRVLNGQSIIPALPPSVFPTYLFLLLPGLFLVAGLTVAGLGLPPVLHTYRLYQSGEVRAATLRGVTRKTTSRRPKRQYFLLSYTYPGRAGQPLVGESMTNDWLLVDGQQPGDTMRIFVSPTDETQSCLVPQLEALAVPWPL